MYQNPITNRQNIDLSYRRTTNFRSGCLLFFARREVFWKHFQQRDRNSSRMRLHNSPKMISFKDSRLCETFYKFFSVNGSCSIVHLVVIKRNRSHFRALKKSDKCHLHHFCALVLCAWVESCCRIFFFFFNFPKYHKTKEEKHSPRSFNSTFHIVDFETFVTKRKLFFASWTNISPYYSWLEVLDNDCGLRIWLLYWLWWVEFDYEILRNQFDTDHHQPASIVLSVSEISFLCCPS